MTSSDLIYVIYGDACAKSEIETILEGAGYSFLAFSDLDGLIDRIRERRPACIILEASGLGHDSEIMVDLKSLCYPVPILVTSSETTIATAVAAIKAGAFDFIGKPLHGPHLLQRLERAISSGRPSRILDLDVVPHEPLTEREQEIFEWLLTGTTSKEVASFLNIGHRTVEYHRANIQRKFGVNSTAKLLKLVLLPVKPVGKSADSQSGRLDGSERGHGLG